MGKPGKPRQSCKSGQLDSKQSPYRDRLPSQERSGYRGRNRFHLEGFSLSLFESTKGYSLTLLIQTQPYMPNPSDNVWLVRQWSELLRLRGY